LKIALEYDNPEGFCVANRGLGYMEMYKGNFDKSEQYAKAALDTAINYDIPREQMKAYSLISDLSIARHNIRNNKAISLSLYPYKFYQFYCFTRHWVQIFYKYTHLRRFYNYIIIVRK